MEARDRAARYIAYLESLGKEKCVCCGELLTGEHCLNLKLFSLSGYACEACMQAATEYLWG